MRFKIPALFCMLFSLVFTSRLSAQQNKSYLFNDGWLFHKGDITGSEKSVATSQGWRAVQLPHDWSIEGPFSDEWASATAYLPGGIGWYKKTFTSSARWKGKKVFICFDGVYKNSEVWINGHYLGKRPNGFVPFQYELTPYLNFNDGKNLIALKADHSEFADSRWYTGSGIYRDVRLVIKNPVYIQPFDIAFSTPEVSAKSASVQIDAVITNSTVVASFISLKMLLVDAKGKVAVQDAQKLWAKPGVNAVQFKKSISDPVLWSADHPNLYRLKLQVVQNDKVTDEETQPVGVRSVRFDKDNGFFLNGKNLKMKGVCIHDDAGALGVAVPPEVWVRRLKILKEAGVNALRLSHNPHADYLYTLCDQMGFLVMDEAFDEWEIGKNKWVKGWNVGTPSKNGYHEYFKEWAHRDLEAMIKRDRNHPSVILWSIGNEIDYPNDPYSHPVLDSGKNPQIYGRGYSAKNPPASDLTVIAKDLVKTVKMFDTTRPVTAALAGVVMSNKVGYPEALDIVGYNYEEYRYADDHKIYPNRIIYGSENGMALQAWEAVDTNKYISGQYLWTGIDYLGEAGKWPQRSNGAGLIDLAGFKKPEYYFRQSLWSDKPMVYLGVKDITQKEDGGIWSHRNVQSLWNWTDRSKLRVECFTNCKEAELFLNGKSLGKILRDTSKGRVPAWVVDYQPGVLSINGYNDGKLAATYSVKTFRDAAQIIPKPDQTIFSKSKKGLCQVELQIADCEGNPVYVGDNDISVSISGDAKLLGLESGSTVSHESYQANHRQALQGRLLAYIQPGKTAGKITVSFNSPGLKSSSIVLSVK